MTPKSFGFLTAWTVVVGYLFYYVTTKGSEIAYDWLRAYGWEEELSHNVSRSIGIVLLAPVVLWVLHTIYSDTKDPP